MTAARVDVTAGAGYDLLISAVAVADPDWCAVLTHGPQVRAAVQHAGGAGLVRDAARFGSFGWINLCGLLARASGPSGPAGREQLLAAIADRRPTDLHLEVVGAGRAELATTPAGRLEAAVTGDASAWTEVRRVLAEPGQRLAISSWLQRTPSRQVREVLLRTVRAWPELSSTGDARTALRRARAARRELTPAGLLGLVTSGITYGPAVLDRVLLVSCRYVEPILIWVDETARTIIVHPPVGEGGLADAGSVLAVSGAAVGDETRLRLLRELRAGPRTLVDLGQALDRPRTTLLHHLALLRAAGLVSLTVSTGEANVYRLDPSGFEALARAAKGFVLR